MNIENGFSAYGALHSQKTMSSTTNRNGGGRRKGWFVGRMRKTKAKIRTKDFHINLSNPSGSLFVIDFFFLYR